MRQRENAHRHVERTVGDVSSPGELTRAIVDAVADATDTPASDLEASLYDVVEPEALSEVLEAAANSHVSFVYGECGVVVASDGSLLVDPNPSFAGDAGHQLRGVSQQS